MMLQALREIRSCTNICMMWNSALIYSTHLYRLIYPIYYTHIRGRTSICILVLHRYTCIQAYLSYASVRVRESAVFHTHSSIRHRREGGGSGKRTSLTRPSSTNHRRGTHILCTLGQSRQNLTINYLKTAICLLRFHSMYSTHSLLRRPISILVGIVYT